MGNTMDADRATRAKEMGIMLPNDDPDYTGNRYDTQVCWREQKMTIEIKIVNESREKNIVANVTEDNSYIQPYLVAGYRVSAYPGLPQSQRKSRSHKVEVTLEMPTVLQRPRLSHVTESNAVVIASCVAPVYVPKFLREQPDMLHEITRNETVGIATIPEIDMMNQRGYKLMAMCDFSHLVPRGSREFAQTIVRGEHYFSAELVMEKAAANSNRKYYVGLFPTNLEGTEMIRNLTKLFADGQMRLVHMVQLPDPPELRPPGRKLNILAVFERDDSRPKLQYHVIQRKVAVKQAIVNNFDHSWVYELVTEMGNRGWTFCACNLGTISDAAPEVGVSIEGFNLSITLYYTVIFYRYKVDVLDRRTVPLAKTPTVSPTAGITDGAVPLPTTTTADSTDSGTRTTFATALAPPSQSQPFSRSISAPQLVPTNAAPLSASRPATTLTKWRSVTPNTILSNSRSDPSFSATTPPSPRLDVASPRVLSEPETPRSAPSNL